MLAVTHSGRVSIATMSWARSPAEEVLLRRSLSLLAARDYPIAIADRGTNSLFLEFLHSLTAVHVVTPHEPGLVAQVRASLEVACSFRRPRILYVEPDKELFFRDGLEDFLDRALRELPHGLALAARSAESFATYPPMQRYTESVTNHLCGEMIGQPGDYSYGPFVMPPTLLPRMETLDGQLGWGWRPAVFGAARGLGLPLRHIVGHYPCPPEQRSEDDSERTHRVRQLSQNILGILA